jgi:PAS domain S-box-containing protein
VTGSILDRQLRRLGLTPDRPPSLPVWQDFLERVTETYSGHQQDRYLLERSMTLSSAEMRDLHDTLRRDRERLRAVIDSLDVGLVVLDAGLAVELANPEAARILGASASQLRAWSLAELLRCSGDDADLCGLLHSLTADDGAPAVRGGVHDARLRNAEGRLVPVSVSVVPVQHLGTAMGAVVVLRDLSELQELEIKLRQAQKLEAVGRLAAGIAHELNTPIQFIGDNLKFLRGCLADLLTAVELANTDARIEEGTDLQYLLDDLPEALSQSLEGVERVTSIVRAMKSFAHPGHAHPAPADLNQALRDTVTVARNEVKDVADVTMELGELPSVECLVHDLKQVFLNLVVNAAHAIGDRRKVDPRHGLVTIRTWHTADEVAISIADDGCGIPAEIAEHVWEPFFTTKEVGRGTGQGLALARSIIVEGHGGTITLDSEPMRGTTFLIRLPIRFHTGADGAGSASRTASPRATAAPTAAPTAPTAAP